ncbi:hypothetical protein HELRODRAFT_173002 [Helobdella robusta]|uniref:Uncharacterized protein n=1 Tax=Helobdella robusta TaxID=6412 RepID=T1F693_HELRO|nr:hypothetical protein HELRODRAFT_173002 [Helobdella robusta]ESO03963.1 hypothetical protein HELRODRAFT_173002 [Helobdella robusta]
MLKMIQEIMIIYLHVVVEEFQVQVGVHCEINKRYKYECKCSIEFYPKMERWKLHNRSRFVSQLSLCPNLLTLYEFFALSIQSGCWYTRKAYTSQASHLITSTKLKRFRIANFAAFQCKCFDSCLSNSPIQSNTSLVVFAQVTQCKLCNTWHGFAFNNRKKCSNQT